MEKKPRLIDFWPQALFLIMAIAMMQLMVAKAEDRYPLADVTHEGLAYCFNDYVGWRNHKAVNVELLDAVCEYMEINGLEYVHHSDWREKSTHPAGQAIDFRFVRPGNVPAGEWYRDHTWGLLNYLVSTGRECWGMGIYFDTRNRFWHVDTGKDLACGRRWARVQGKYVSFGAGVDVLIREARGF